MGRMKRKGFTVGQQKRAKERAQIIAEYEQSGLTQRGFAEGCGMSLATLTNWLRAHRRRDEKDGGREVRFEAVDVRGMLGSAWAAEVVMPNGSVLRVGAQVEAGLAERLMKALRGSC